MILAISRQCGMILLAGLLAGSSFCSTGAVAQTALPPDNSMFIHPPVPLPVLLYFSNWPPKAPAAQPVTCPPHMKKRLDCTPPSQR
jgi:hypothetical protein